MGAICRTPPTLRVSRCQALRWLLSNEFQRICTGSVFWNCGRKSYGIGSSNGPERHAFCLDAARCPEHDRHEIRLWHWPLRRVHDSHRWAADAFVCHPAFNGSRQKHHHHRSYTTLARICHGLPKLDRERGNHRLRPHSLALQEAYFAAHTLAYRFDRCCENVSSAALSADQLLSIALDLNRPAQPSHLHIDGAVVHFVVVQPRKLEQLLARKDTFWRCQKGDQQVELTVGHRERLAVRRFQPTQSDVELPSREAIRANAREAVDDGLLFPRAPEQ